MVLNCSAQEKSGLEPQALSCGSKSCWASSTGLGERVLQWCLRRRNGISLPSPARAQSAVCLCVCVLQDPEKIHLSSVSGANRWTSCPYFVFTKSWMHLFLLLLNTYFVLGGVCEEKGLYYFPFLSFRRWRCLAPEGRGGGISVLWQGGVFGKLNIWLILG